MAYRFHVAALPHTHTSPDYCMCAYTMKIWNFCRMMRSLGHEVYHYGGNESRVDCTEHVTVLTHEEQDLLIGKHDHRVEPCRIKWDANAAYWALLNARTALEVAKRSRPGDFLCVIAGLAHKPISDMLKDRKLVTVEYGIGYGGTYAPFRVFESNAFMHMMRGAQDGRDPDVRWYDAVIPNYFDPAMFPYQAQKSDYLLYLGRLISRKGLVIAAQTAEAAGMRLLVGGSGAKHYEPGLIVCEDGTEMKCKGLTYLGVLNATRRAEIMGKARALLAPTIYLEPFGGVAVEAMMCGTPVITSNAGAFTETVENGKTGWCCNNLEQFTWAAQHAPELDTWYIHQRAVAKWSLWNVRWMYQEYFDMLSQVERDKGWYAMPPRAGRLDWQQQRPLGSGYDSNEAKDYNPTPVCPGRHGHAHGADTRPASSLPRPL